MPTTTRQGRSHQLAPGMSEAAAVTQKVHDLVRRAATPRHPATTADLWDALPRFAIVAREAADHGELTDEEAVALVDAFVSRAIAARVRERFLGTLAGERLGAPGRRYGRTDRWLGT